MRILIADRDRRVCRVLCRIMDRVNFECFSAHGHRVFKSLCPEIEPDVIILSLDMAIEQDNLLEYLADRHSNASIILLSNLDEDEIYHTEIVDQASRLNIGGFLRKPVDIDSVKSILDTLEKKQAGTIKKSSGTGEVCIPCCCCTPA